MNELAGSNSLADLAARIRIEHRAASDKLSEALTHAMAAGDLLIEAKAQIPHGGWLPWLAANVEISDRTAQVYMRAAKNRTEIEAHAQSAADLSLGEAMALLALSSDVRKLLSFVKRCEGLDGEDLIKACLDAGVAVITTPGYDPFHGRSDEQRREWKLFGLWLLPQLGVEGAQHHLEWLLRTGDGDLSEWLGENGDRYRARFGMRFSDKLKADWAKFSASRAMQTEAEIEAETEVKAVVVGKQQADLEARYEQGDPSVSGNLSVKNRRRQRRT